MPKQLALIEKTPHEESWEAMLEILRHKLGEATANSWLANLRFKGCENGVLLFDSANAFIADQVKSLYTTHLLAAWNSLGFEAQMVKITACKNQAA